MFCLVECVVGGGRGESEEERGRKGDGRRAVGEVGGVNAEAARVCAGAVWVAAALSGRGDVTQLWVAAVAAGVVVDGAAVDAGVAGKGAERFGARRTCGSRAGARCAGGVDRID
jgi:hypothetical protein